MAIRSLTCAGCGAQFSCSRSSKYCSRGCWPSANGGTSTIPSAGCNQWHECKVCGVSFKPKRAGRTTTCGRECGFVWSNAKMQLIKHGGRVWVRLERNRPKKPSHIMAVHPPTPERCKHCGAAFYRSTRYQRYCDPTCGLVDREANARRNQKIKNAKREARKRGCLRLESIDPIKVFERDAWRCGICGRKTQKAKRGTYHKRAPEMDHIVAIANGGSHTWDNVQCSCRECNGLKGARDYGQIPLFSMVYGGVR